MLSTVWIPQKYSWSYTEKRRGRKETEVARRINVGGWGGQRKRDRFSSVARRIKGRIKRRETDPVQISSLSVLHSPEHTKRFTELGREQKGEGGDKGDLVEKKESQKWERAIKPVISLPSKNGY